MMEMTKKKMVLEHLVVGRLKAQNINQVNNYFLKVKAFVVKLIKLMVLLLRPQFFRCYLVFFSPFSYFFDTLKRC